MMIRTRLLILFVIMTFLPALVISIVAWQGGIQASGTQIVRQLESVVTLKSTFIEVLLDNHQQELQSLLNTALFRPRAIKLLQFEDDPIMREAFRASLQHSIEARQQFQQIHLITLAGQIVISTDLTKNNTIVTEPWLSFLAQAGQTPRDQILNIALRYSLVSAQPIFDSAGKSVGVLVGETDLSAIEFVMNERTGLGNTGITYLVSPNKQLLTNHSLLPSQINTPGVETAITTQSHLAGEYSNPQNNNVFGVYHWLPQLETVLVAEQNKAEAYAPTYAILRTSVFVAIGSLLIAFVMGLWMTQTISRPLQALVMVASDIAQGNLTLKADVSRADEFGQLATSFNDMTAQLRQLITNLEEQNEELKRMDRLKDDFLANTSHELRTPLTGIVGIAESMKDGATGEVSHIQQNNLEMIITSGERLARLVDDILDFSKLHRQQLNLNILPLSLFPVVDMVLRVLAPLRNNKPIALINQVSPNLQSVQADENRLNQILYNLIGNAIKFTDEGQIIVSAVADGTMMTITVSDTGIGIAEDQRDTIFKAFEQGDGSTARKYGGTGLGLAVTQQLVHLHGGIISVKSQVGQGSQFTFTLHLAEEEAIAVAQSTAMNNAYAVIPPDDGHPAKTESPLEPVEGEFRILVVDDEPVNRQVLYNQLSLQSYHITTVPDGAAALEHIDQNETPFDLIVLDVMMPYMSGYEVCREIRQVYSLNELPIIMLTAKNQPDDVVTGFNAGANDYLTKPFVKMELLARIRVHLQVSDLRQLNASKDRFFSIVAHDLKSPFGPLLGFAELLQATHQELSSTEVGEMSASIYRSAKNVYALLENLLDWSRLQMGRMPFDPQAIQLEKVAYHIITLFAEKADEKKINLQTTISPTLYTQADDYMVNMVLRNLTSNALKFTPPGGTVTISATVRNGHQSPKQVEVSVIDTGVGMAELDQQKLFQVGVHHTTLGTANENGTGLGLIMCREMVEKHGGCIWVNSTLGKGCAFSFTLPWIIKP